jgi:hypothetical protein
MCFKKMVLPITTLESEYFGKLLRRRGLEEEYAPQAFQNPSHS